MTGTITLSDQGQSYIIFAIDNNVIMSVLPSTLQGWTGTQILNKAITVGGRLIVELHNGYRLALKYPIVSIT